LNCFNKTPSMMIAIGLIGLILFAIHVPANASTPRAYAALDRQTHRTCIEVSGLRDATATTISRFSDQFGIDAINVTGIYPQAHMYGAAGNMMCLYNRITGKAEVQEMGTGAKYVFSASLKDVVWRVRTINGRPVGGNIFTLILGSDGKVIGKSACNSYSGSYVLADKTFQLSPEMIVTPMACPRTNISEEIQFRETLVAVSSISFADDGTLLLQSSSGKSLRLERTTDY
jgi:heat shock protein HslJ